MEAQRTTTCWTWAEFARLPSEGSTRYEIVGGELVVTPAPSLTHQRVVTDLGSLLKVFVQANDVGQFFAAPVDVLFGEGDYIEPDIVFVRKDRAEILSERGIEGPPDLVVEILSPATAARDRGIKLERYRHFGVVEYWIVDPSAGTIELWALAAGATEPRVLGPKDTLHWSPIMGGATLEIGVRDVLRGA